MPTVVNPPTSGPRAPLVAPPPPPIVPNAVFRIGGGAISGATSRDHSRVAVDAYQAQINVAARDETVPILLGRNRVGAQISRALAYGTHMLIVCLWGRGTVAGFDAFTMGDAFLPSACTVTHYDGSQVTADPKLVSAFIDVGVTWSNALTGFAYSVVDLAPRNVSGGPVNIADFHAIIRGWKAYDPRDGAQSYASPGTWTYTTNPALLAARVMTDATAGMGVTPDAAFWSSVGDVATRCDFDIGGGTKRRELNVVLNQPAAAEELLRVLADYAGCWIVPEGASFRFIPNAVATAGAAITKANIIAGTFRVRGTDSTARPNLVYVRYTEETASGAWRTALAPRGTDVPAIPAGEEPRVSVVDMPGNRTYDQARRVAIERQNHAYLEDISFEFDMPAAAVVLQLGDVRPITYGIFTSKLMRLVGMSLSSLGRWQTRWDEYDPASYNDTIVTAPTYVDSSLADPNVVPAVTGLVLTETIEPAGVGGRARSSIAISWDAISNYPFLAGYRVYIYNDAGRLVQEESPLANSCQSAIFAAPQRFLVIVKARSSQATAVDYASATITLSGGTTSLTLLKSVDVLAAGATLVNYEAYTRYPGDPYLRIAPIPDSNATFLQQFVTDAINAATPNVLSHNRYLVSQTRSDTYAKTAAIDLGASKQVTVAIDGAPVPNDFNLMLGFEAADSLAGPWAFALGTLVVVTGRYVRLVVAPRDDPPAMTLPDGGALLGPPPWAVQFEPLEFDLARISIFGATIEETGTATSSAAGAFTVTMSRTYAAMRDLQVTALDANGTAIVTANNPGPSSTAISQFEVNATQAGVRVAVPFRWSFRGAV